MRYTDFYPAILQENRKQAKELVTQGKLSPEDFEFLVRIDPSPTKKYTGWMAKQWVNKATSGITSNDDLKNKIEEYDAFLNSGKAKTKDVYQFKTFTDLKKEVDELNAMGPESKSELREDYEIVVDNDKLIVAVPHSHEASRYLGLSKFAYRECKDEQGNVTGKDSAWCTTYKAPDHFQNYYFKQQITLYYVRVKDPALIELVKAAFPKEGPAMVTVALLVNKDGKLFDGYDANDESISVAKINKFRKIIGL